MHRPCRRDIGPCTAILTADDVTLLFTRHISSHPVADLRWGELGQPPQLDLCLLENPCSPVTLLSSDSPFFSQRLSPWRLPGLLLRCARSKKMSLQLGLWPASGPTAQASKAHHSKSTYPFPSLVLDQHRSAARTTLAPPVAPGVGGTQARLQLRVARGSNSRG
jgi:hypothetical protein